MNAVYQLLPSLYDLTEYNDYIITRGKVKKDLFNST